MCSWSPIVEVCRPGCFGPSTRCSAHCSNQASSRQKKAACNPPGIAPREALYLISDSPQPCPSPRRSPSFCPLTLRSPDLFFFLISFFLSASHSTNSTPLCERVTSRPLLDCLSLHTATSLCFFFIPLFLNFYFFQSLNSNHQGPTTRYTRPVLVALIALLRLATSPVPPRTGMPLSAALAGRAPALLRHGRRIPQTLASARAFTTSAATVGSSARHSIRLQQAKRWTPTTAARCFSARASQEAPNPKAYLESGVIKPQQTVDVKKVLVIGSGGLAIGQAGEFDYSGASPSISRLLNSSSPSQLTRINHRFTSPQGPERGRRRFCSHQPQHCHHPDQPLPRRRGLLPARHRRIRLLCH